MRDWRMSLRRTKSTIISWAGSISHLFHLNWHVATQTTHCQPKKVLFPIVSFFDKKFGFPEAMQYEPPHDKTNKMTVRPLKAQVSLGIRPVWSESSLCAQWVAKDPSFVHAVCEDSDQTGRMPRLVWVFAGLTCHFIVVVFFLWGGSY